MIDDFFSEHGSDASDQTRFQIFLNPYEIAGDFDLAIADFKLFAMRGMNFPNPLANDHFSGLNGWKIAHNHR